MPPTFANNIFGVVGVVALILGLIYLGRRIWHRIPHPHRDLLHRLSEISLLLAEQNRIMKEPPAPDRCAETLCDLATLIARQSEALEKIQPPAAGIQPDGWLDERFKTLYLKQDVVIKLADNLRDLPVIRELLRKQMVAINRLCRALGAPPEEDADILSEADREEASIRRKARRYLDRYPEMTEKQAMERARIEATYHSNASAMGDEG